jgi:hypothetical protein
VTPDPNNVTIVSPRPGIDGLPKPTDGRAPTVGACDRCGTTIWSVNLPAGFPLKPGSNPLRRICSPCNDLEEIEADEQTEEAK